MRSSCGHGVSFWECFVLLAKVIIGGAVFTMPACFELAGSRGALLVIITMSCVMLATARIVQRANEESQAGPDYQDVVRGHLGNRAAAIAELTIAVYQTLTCCVFALVVGDIFAPVVELGLPLSFYRWSKTIAAGVFLLPGFFICFYPRIGHLSAPMGYGLACVVLSCLIIIVDGCTGLPNADVRAWPTDAKGIFATVPTVAFAMQVHVHAPRIFNESQGVRQLHFSVVVLVYMFITAFYCSVGYCGYHRFGSMVQGDILLNYADTRAVAFLTSLNAFQANMAYALNHFMARSAVYSILLRVGFTAENAESQPFLAGQLEVPEPYRSRITVWNYLFAIAIVSMVSDLQKLSTLIGATCGSLVIFIFPAMFAWKLSRPLLAVAFASFGVICSSCAFL